jgi:hypothetical protein
LPAPCRAGSLEFRAGSEAHETGGGSIHPRFPNFADPFLRIRPTRIVSWGLAGQDGVTPDEFRVNARDVGQG